MATDFFGTGWSFPPTFYGGGAEVELVSGEADIRQSLQIILSTSMNERIMHSGFGCELNRFVFDEIDVSLINKMRSLVSDALLKHEPRIQVKEVDIQVTGADNGLLLISINYLVRTTNNRYNLVYPFYLKEATI